MDNDLSDGDSADGGTVLNDGIRRVSTTARDEELTQCEPLEKENDGEQRLLSPWIPPAGVSSGLSSIEWLEPLDPSSRDGMRSSHKERLSGTTQAPDGLVVGSRNWLRRRRGIKPKRRTGSRRSALQPTRMKMVVDSRGHASVILRTQPTGPTLSSVDCDTLDSHSILQWGHNIDLEGAGDNDSDEMQPEYDAQQLECIADPLDVLHQDFGDAQYVCNSAHPWSFHNDIDLATYHYHLTSGDDCIAGSYLSDGSTTLNAAASESLHGRSQSSFSSPSSVYSPSLPSPNCFKSADSLHTVDTELPSLQLVDKSDPSSVSENIPLMVPDSLASPAEMDTVSRLINHEEQARVIVEAEVNNAKSLQALCQPLHRNQVGRCSDSFLEPLTPVPSDACSSSPSPEDAADFEPLNWKQELPSNISKHAKFPESPSCRQWVCPVKTCAWYTMGFASRREYWHHIRKVHRFARYNCRICNAKGDKRSYIQPEGLRRHLLKAHIDVYDGAC